MRRLIGAACAALLLLIAAGSNARAATMDGLPVRNTGHYAILDTDKGNIVVELYPAVAPKTVENFETLTKKGFYNGLTFHRVVPGFVVQGGDPKGDGSGGSGQTVPHEYNNAHFVRGTVGLARAQDPDSGDSQFFICFAPAPNLDGKYAIFGQVVSGMEHIDAIKKGDPAQNGAVVNPDHIVRMQIAADADKDKK